VEGKRAANLPGMKKTGRLPFTAAADGINLDVMKSVVRQKTLSSESGYLDGQLLIAAPNMTDPRFARSVIYLCAHSAEGAMGIVINQRAPNLNFVKLLQQLDIFDEDSDIRLPADIGEMAVYVGGPVDKSRGFVLHTQDYYATNSTLVIGGGVSLTATVDILKALAHGGGPKRALMALGYAGWDAGQLESEIHANGWLNCEADPDLIFNPDIDHKYELAYAKLGIDPTFLVSEAGHA
jgi:putative transcriptional regulator